MIHLIPVQATLFSAFVVFVWANYGIQPSISDSWYALGKKHPLFTIWLWGVGFTMMGMAVHLDTLLYYFSGVFLCFTGTAAEFKNKMTGTIHVIGAIGGIFLAMAGLMLDGMWLPCLFFAVGSLIIRRSKIKATTWWIEIWAFICIESGFILLA